MAHEVEKSFRVTGPNPACSEKSSANLLLQLYELSQKTMRRAPEYVESTLCNYFVKQVVSTSLS